MLSFTVLIVIQQARLKSLSGRFWPPGLMFDTPAPELMWEDFSSCSFAGLKSYSLVLFGGFHTEVFTVVFVIITAEPV